MDKLKVSLPKFSIRGSLELNEPLASLNISKLFGAGGPDKHHHDDPMTIMWRSYDNHVTISWQSVQLFDNHAQAQISLVSSTWRQPQLIRCNQNKSIQRTPDPLPMVFIPLLNENLMAMITLIAGGPGSVGVCPAQGFHWGFKENEYHGIDDEDDDDDNENDNSEED